jgi:CBS domain-containing protein
MHDVVEFLLQHAPFENLSEEELERLARAVEVEFFPAGSAILEQGEAAAEHARIVRRGSVELLDQGEVVDVLGESEIFGLPSMLSGRSTQFEARAAEDTLTYRLAADVVVPLLARPAGLRFVADSLLTRPRPKGAAVGGVEEPAMAQLPDPLQQPVALLVHEQPVICKVTDTVREAARRMTKAQASAALVRREDGRLGIVTDRDLRDRVVAAGTDVDTPLAEVMSFPAHTISPQRLGAEVMLEMLDRDIRHMPVVWPQGDVLGILTDRDLLATETRAPFSLRRAIDNATDTRQLRRAVAQLRPAVIALYNAEVPPVQVGSIIGVVCDALVRRLLELSIEELGTPPCPFTWLALGSMGRREAVPSSDVDSALIWDGDEEDDRASRYMQALGSRVVEELSAYGFPADRHGATAGGALFDQASDGLRRMIRNCIANPEQEKALTFLSLLLDARGVYTFGPARDPLDVLHGSLEHRRPLLRMMLALSLAQKPPSGLRRRRGPIRLGKESRLDIKKSGMMPVVDVARYAGLAAGVHLISTRERLNAAAVATKLEGGDARALTEAFGLFWRLRLGHQVEQMRNGIDPDEMVDVEVLDPLTRRYLREAFDAVREVQQTLRASLALPP